MKRAKKHRIKEEASGSVNPNEHDLAYYIHDRVELMHQVFSVLKPKELKAMAPECVRHISVNDLQELCTEELLGISSKRLCAILDGAEPPSDTESSSESSQERLETISLDSISSDDEILSQVTTKKKKHKHHSKGKSKKRRTQDSGDEAGNQDTSRRTGLTVLEILELQARARAIRAQLQKEQAAIASNGRPSESATGNSSDGEVEIKEEAAEVVEISSEDEKPNVQELQEKIATPSNETANNDANSKTITKKVNDLVITVPKNTTRKIRLRRSSILNKNPKTVVDTNVPTTSTSVSTTSTTEAAKAKANTNTQSTSTSTEANKTKANTNVQSEKQNPKESVITVETTDKGKDKKKKRKKDKQKYKYGSDHDEITLQLSDTEKMDLLEDLDGKQFEKSSETEDSSADSDSDESVDKNKDIDNDKRMAKVSKEKSKAKVSKSTETTKGNLNEKEITVISKETNLGQKETKYVESTVNNKSDSENNSNIVDNETETNITDVSNDTRTEEVLKENDVVDKSDKNSETCDNTIMTSEVNNESQSNSNDIENVNENDNEKQNTEENSRDLQKEKEVQNQEVEVDNTQNTEARSRDLQKEKEVQNKKVEVYTIKDKNQTDDIQKDKSNETNNLDTEIQIETVDITQSKDNLMESGTTDNEDTNKRSLEGDNINKRSVEKSEGELSDRDSSEVEASEVKPDVVCISDDEVKGKKKKKKDKKCKKAKKAKKNKDFRESADQNFYTEASMSKEGSIQISDSNQIDINESENLVNTEESLNNEVILIQDTKKTDDSNTNSTEIGPNTDIDDDVYEILELSDDSSCYEVEEISISKEPTTEEIEAFTAKIDEIERDRTINIDESEGDRTSDIEDLEHVSWKDRYLKSNKVKKVLNTSNILNAIRKKNLDLKKKLQESKMKPIIENEVVEEIIPNNLEEGSIEQYNTLDTCNKYVNPVKDDEENQEIDKEKEIKDPVTKEMKKDAKQLLKMYKMLLKYNDTTKTKDMSKKRKKKKKSKDKDKSQSTVS